MLIPTFQCGVATIDPLPIQAIGYMENIELSPTRLDVVQHTMMKSKRVRVECQEEYMLVAFDLAIARPAIRIQETESPTFDQLFIELGPFHLQERERFAHMSGLIKIKTQEKC